MALTNYATICRLCLQQDGYLLAIFNSHVNDIDNSILKKIMECTTLEVSSGDGLPPCICHRCLYKIELCLEFKAQCLLSDATLRQINSQYPHRMDRNNERISDQESTDTQLNTSIRTVSAQDFEKFNQKFIPDNGQNAENLVLVVNPDVDYDSDNESDVGNHSDADNNDLPEFNELKNVFMCKFCDRAFIEKEACRIHEITEHNSELPFVCSTCERGFVDRSSYISHAKSYHLNEKPFGCPQCPRSFGRRSDLRKHTVVHTGIKPFTCKICFKSFSRNTNLTKHLRIHSGHKPYICPQCPKTFISKGDLTRHALIHTGDKPFNCIYCAQSFGRKDKLVRHEKRHFPNINHHRTSADSELQILRQQIALNYPYENNVNPEVEEDHDVEGKWSGENMVISVDPFNHDENFSQTEEQSDLPRVPDHITADEPSFNEFDLKVNVAAINKYPCFVCHKRFPTAETLRNHSAMHSMDKSHACTICPKAFLRKRELERHMATHTGTKPFKCTQCGKRFGRKDKLVRHTRIHSVVKEHVCMVCGSQFSRAENLTAHMKVHSTNCKVEEPLSI